MLFFFGGGACNAWRSHAFARGVRGHAAPKNFFEWCVLEHIFIIFFTFKKPKNITFIQK